MKIHLFIFTIGIALGLLLSFAYHALLIDLPPTITNRQVVKNLEKGVVHAEVGYIKKSDSIKAQEVRLQVQLKATKLELAKTKQNNNALQKSARALLNKRFKGTASILFQNNNP